MILQRQIEANSIEIARTTSRFDTIKVSERSTEQIQIMSLKEKCHKQEQTIHSLEDRAIAAEQERDSLRLSLCILMQNQSHQRPEQNSNELLEVKKQKSESGAREQKDMKYQLTTLSETQNRFGPLQIEIEEDRAEDDPVNHKSDKTTESCWKSVEIKKTKVRKTSKTPTETPIKEIRPQRTTVIIGDSMIKNQRGWELGKVVRHRVVVKSFPGAKNHDMAHYIKPSIQSQPDEIILHCGTNDLQKTEVKAVTEGIINLAKQIENEADLPIKVTISELICRSDSILNNKVSQVNKQLSKYCRQNGWDLISHSNITVKDLNKGGIHLLPSGNATMFSNLIKHLN